MPSEAQAPTGPAADNALRETQNWAARSHRELYEAVHVANDPGRVGELAQQWSRLSSEMAEAAQQMAERLRATESGWQGEAATAARSAIQKLADWNVTAGETAGALGEWISAQGRIMETAKAQMPEPVEGAENLEKFAAATFVAGNMEAFHKASADARVLHERSSSAHQQAVEVMTWMEKESRVVDSDTPRFTRPPNPLEDEQPHMFGRSVAQGGGAGGPGGAQPQGGAGGPAGPGAPVDGQQPGGQPLNPQSPGGQAPGGQPLGGPGGGQPHGGRLPGDEITPVVLPGAPSRTSRRCRSSSRTPTAVAVRRAVDRRCRRPRTAAVGPLRRSAARRPVRTAAEAERPGSGISNRAARPRRAPRSSRRPRIPARARTSRTSRGRSRAPTAPPSAVSPSTPAAGSAVPAVSSAVRVARAPAGAARSRRSRAPAVPEAPGWVVPVVRAAVQAGPAVPVPVPRAVRACAAGPPARAA
ncbi:PPE domain-containing protein [Saccharopolyspora spinosporotrichia]